MYKYRSYRPLLGPTFGTLYDELAVIAESGISPDSIPNASSHSSEKKEHTNYLRVKKTLEYFFILEKTVYVILTSEYTFVLMYTEILSLQITQEF